MSLSPAKIKKRKHEQDVDIPRKEKKARKHRDKDNRKRKDEGKARASEFAQVDATLVVAIPPVFAATPAQGADEMLDSMLMRYIPPLRGVVLAHDNLRFLDPAAEVQGDSPFAVARVAFSATVWSPRVGQQLTGHITLSSPDHVALLVHCTFNAAIPAMHLPRHEWEFVPGAETEVDVPMAGDEEEEGGEGEAKEHQSGQWMHKHTHVPLGGPAGTLAFTVIGLTIANQMLSVVGSILPDPFAPVPTQQNDGPIEPVSAPEAAHEPTYPDDEDEDDPFAALGRSTDLMTQRPSTEKKKRKKDKDGNEGDVVKKRKKDKHKHKAKSEA